MSTYAKAELYKNDPTKSYGMDETHGEYSQYFFEKLFGANAFAGAGEGAAWDTAGKKEADRPEIHDGFGEAPRRPPGQGEDSSGHGSADGYPRSKSDATPGAAPGVNRGRRVNGRSGRHETAFYSHVHRAVRADRIGRSAALRRYGGLLADRDPPYDHRQGGRLVWDRQDDQPRFQAGYGSQGPHDSQHAVQ